MICLCVTRGRPGYCGFDETLVTVNMPIPHHAIFLFSSTHYSADEWNLRKPLQECSLRIERRGEILLVVFTYKKEGSPPALFAVCKVDPIGTGENIDHWVQPVGDSSRFFAIRVTDEKGGREAVIGLGFREREEAEDFTQSIINYQNAITRERMERANEMVNQ